MNPLDPSARPQIPPSPDEISAACRKKEDLKEHAVVMGCSLYYSTHINKHCKNTSTNTSAHTKDSSDKRQTKQKGTKLLLETIKKSPHTESVFWLKFEILVCPKLRPLTYLFKIRDIHKELLKRQTNTKNKPVFQCWCFQRLRWLGLLLLDYG